jgi:PAS domain S-box-containing protein
MTPDTTTAGAEALRQSEARLQAAVDLVGLARYAWNPQTNALDWDARLKGIWGLPADAEVTYDIWRRGVHPDDLDRVEAAIALCTDPRHDGIYDMEYRVIGLGDGVERWIHTRGQTYFQNGRPIEFLAVALDITDRKLVEADLIAAQAALSAELAAMNQLHQLSARLTAVTDLSSLLHEVLDAIIQLQRADFGDVQLYNPQTRTLQIVAQRGFNDEFLAHFANVEAGDGSACGQALQHRRRVVIEDVNEEPSFAQYRSIAAAAGFRAVQSTPLTASGNGGPIGMLSTQFRNPHRPSERDLRTTDLYARQAADVIASRLAEERARRHEALTSAMLQQLPIGVGLTDRDGRFLLRAGLLGQMWDPVMPSRDSPQAARWQSFDTDGSRLAPTQYPGARALRGETIVPGIDFIHTAEDGRETWIRVGAVPFRNPAGEIEGAVATLEDIDKEKRAEQAIRESEERFRHFAQNSSDVLWILDTHSGRFEYVSPAYEQIWGQSRCTFLKHWTEAMHEDDREAWLAALQRIQLGESMVRKYRIVRLDGPPRWIRETLFPIPDQRGRIRRVGGISQDITVRTSSFIYLVGHDDASRESTSHVLHKAGYSVKPFVAGSDFLQMVSALAPGCVVLDSRSPQAASLSVLRQLTINDGHLPVIVTGISGGNVGMVVQVMRAGASNWLEIPFKEAELLAAVSSALSDIHTSAKQERDAEVARARIAGMSERERQVLEGLVDGGSNKTIARDLGISPRTVEMHRANVMERLGAESLPEAVLLAAAAGLRPRR